MNVHKQPSTQLRTDTFARGVGVLGERVQRRRCDVDQVTSIHRILQALEMTKALPETLQAALQGDDDQVAAAVQQYATLAPVLRACGHKVGSRACPSHHRPTLQCTQGVFRKVSTRVEALRMQLVSVLLSRIAEGPVAANPSATRWVTVC